MFKKVAISVAVLSLVDAKRMKQMSDFRPLEGTAPWYKMASHATWVDPDWDINYPVPNFGVDHDIIAT